MRSRYGLIGVGLAALLRDQVATVVGLLVYLFGEPIITRVPAFESRSNYLPGAAAAALTHVAQNDQKFLAPWAGGVVLACYGIGLAVAGTVTAMRRDVI